MKGISPLIAAVLLIAFTMAIAGIMATWATTFSRERLSGASAGAQCIGALDLDSLGFNNGIVSIKIRNTKDALNLTDFIGSLEYSDAEKSRTHENIILKDYNVTDPLGPARNTWLIYDTGDNATVPNKISIVASNCLEHPAELSF